MTTSSPPVIDYRGDVMFHCSGCLQPLTRDDFFELGMRMPDSGESREDYIEAELVDELRHPSCARGANAG